MANSNFVRVVLDTNVLISAALKPGGLEASVVAAALAGHVEVWVTSEVWAEYEEVLARPKFAKVRAQAQLMLGALGAKVHRTAATAPVTSATDEDDNRFLECAAAADASYLVTGNLRHYPLEWGPTRMVNARGFADATGLIH
ncbi:MAG: nucleic acid-binding protein contains domain-like protein [Bryobacterales bacterium]|nr:nucleic acid-binding protein contains domain-like protein [Bryobacterales bacterium]